jgi:surfeit locus 1 family protein
MMSRRVFKPRFIPAVVTVLVLSVLLSLGAWQVSRSHEKQMLLESYAEAPAMAVVTPRDLDRDWQTFKYRRIELSGQYNDKFQVLIENQLHGNEYGYIVLTPFHVADSERVVLVNRGWLKRTDEQLPNIAIVEDVRSIAGLVGSAPGVGVKLGSLDDSASGWPKRLPYIDFDWLALQMGVPIAPWVILLDEREADGFMRSWKPALQMGPEKHKGYAFQWYTMAAVLIFLFVAGSMKPQGPIVEEKDKTTEDK